MRAVLSVQRRVSIRARSKQELGGVPADADRSPDGRLLDILSLDRFGASKQCGHGRERRDAEGNAGRPAQNPFCGGEQTRKFLSHNRLIHAAPFAGVRLIGSPPPGQPVGSQDEPA